MALCTGRGAADGSHCCVIGGEVCEFLEFGTVEGRVFVCGFMRVWGEWEKVYADRAYRERVAPRLRENNLPDCGEWEPPAGQCCRQER